MDKSKFLAIEITIGLRVSNLANAKEWYSRMLGAEPDLQPSPEILEYKITDDLWLQIFESKARNVSGAIVRFGVDDIYRERNRLLDLGITVSEVETVEGAVHFCDFTDPFANRLSLYQLLA